MSYKINSHEINGIKMILSHHLFTMVWYNYFVVILQAHILKLMHEIKKNDIVIIKELSLQKNCI